MRYDECQKEMGRLAKGFNVKLTLTQIEAYFEKLKRFEHRDLAYAVGELLCSPYFPKSISFLIDTVSGAEEMRKEKERLVEKARAGYDGICRPRYDEPRSEGEIAFARLCFDITGIFHLQGKTRHDKHELIKARCREFLAQERLKEWAMKKPTTDMRYHNLCGWIEDLIEDLDAAIASPKSAVPV